LEISFHKRHVSFLVVITFSVNTVQTQPLLKTHQLHLFYNYNAIDGYLDILSTVQTTVKTTVQAYLNCAKVYF